jgi:hypothetical protein
LASRVSAIVIMARRYTDQQGMVTYRLNRLLMPKRCICNTRNERKGAAVINNPHVQFQSYDNLKGSGIAIINGRSDGSELYSITDQSLGDA